MDDPDGSTEKVEDKVVVEIERLVRQIQAERHEQARRLAQAEQAHNRQEADREEEETKQARQSAMAIDRLAEELMRTLHPILFRSAIGIADSEDDAAEVTTEALQRIFRRIDSFAWQAPFLAWCRGFLKLGWKSRLRGLLRYRGRKQKIEQMAEIDDSEGFGGTALLSPFQIAVSRSDFQRLRSLLRGLPRDCWKRLLWAAIGGRTNKEVATRLNETEERAKDRLRDCRERAQKKLAPHGYAR